MIEPTWHPQPSQPAVKLPPRSCDAHFHIFGPFTIFPAPPEATFEAADAPKQQIFALHTALGISRGVIVQSGCHGFDNSVVADAIKDQPQHYKGVALLSPDVDRTTLAQLDEQGFCGARFNYMSHLGTSTPIGEVIALTARLADFGWHLQIHMHSSMIAQLGPQLRQSAVPVVIDHMGRVDSRLGIDQPDFKALFALMEDQKFWVKVSGCDRASRMGAPYRDAVPFARMLVAAFPDRVVWGTDWPHPNFAGPPPDDGTLVDLIAEFAPSASHMNALMVWNPQRLYGFE